MPEILYDTKTCNFTSREDNCASKIANFSNALANFSNAHAQTIVLLNGEMAIVSTCFRKLKFWLWLL